MLTIFSRVLLAAVSANAVLHHLIVGTSNGQALYSLEMNDETRTVYYIQARDASGASPSLVLDKSKQYLFSTRPANGTLTRYSFGPEYALLDEGTMEIPSACNTTAFTSLRLSPTAFNSGIWGSASTGTCSILFGLTTNGYLQLKSKEIAGDIHSLAWTANGQNLHALDSHSSPVEATSIVNFRISEDPSLEDIIATDILANVSHAAEIVSHPTSNRLYVVTKDTNELISVRASDIANSSSTTQLPSRYRLLPSSLDASRFHTSSLAIGASKSTLWALSQSSNQAVITVFSLNATTGEVVDAVARASWAGNGEGQVTAASFAGGDIVAITNSPIGYVTLLGLDQGGVKAAQDADGGYDHAYLEALKMERSDASHINAASAKVKSYGRTALDEYIAIGEAVWVD